MACVDQVLVFFPTRRSDRSEMEWAEFQNPAGQCLEINVPVLDVPGEKNKTLIERVFEETMAASFQTLHRFQRFSQCKIWLIQRNPSQGMSWWVQKAKERNSWKQPERIMASREPFFCITERFSGTWHPRGNSTTHLSTVILSPEKASRMEGR